jgi:general stress protein 26
MTVKTIQEMWNPMYKAWFSEGEEYPQITVVRGGCDGGAVLGGFVEQD